MTRLAALFGVAALVAWAVLRREPKATTPAFDEPGGGW